MKRWEGFRNVDPWKGQARSDIGARRRPQSVEGEAAISVGGSSANTAACASRRIISALTSLTRYVLPSIRRARLSDTNSTIPVVAANRHHLRRNTRHEHDYPCSRTTTGETLHTLSIVPFDVPPSTIPSPDFSFLQRETNLRETASPLQIWNIGHFSTIPSAHVSFSIRPLSLPTAINCCPRERRVPSFSAHAKHPFAPSKPPRFSLERREREARPREIGRGELAIRSNYGAVVPFQRLFSLPSVY